MGGWEGRGQAARPVLLPHLPATTYRLQHHHHPGVQGAGARLPEISCAYSKEGVIVAGEEDSKGDREGKREHTRSKSGSSRVKKKRGRRMRSSDTDHPPVPLLCLPVCLPGTRLLIRPTHCPPSLSGIICLSDDGWHHSYQPTSRSQASTIAAGRLLGLPLGRDLTLGACCERCIITIWFRSEAWRLHLGRSPGRIPDLKVYQRSPFPIGG